MSPLPGRPDVDGAKSQRQQQLTVPELRTQPPSPTDTVDISRSSDSLSIAESLSRQHVIEATSQRATTSTVITDTESESGYTSTHSNAPLEQDPGRLSVFTRRAASKSSSENDRRTMTIETETVANLYTNNALKFDHYGRGVRAKASTDTVRASQKPKKKKSRIAVTNANHVPTKSEIFNATITQAVDENDDTDSDETFVYESNPRSPSKHSNRPPSITSVHSSSGDRRASTSKFESVSSRHPHGGIDHDDRDREKLQRAHAISGKRSMKFANNPCEDDASRRHVSQTLGNQYRRLGADDGTFIKSPRIRPGLDKRQSSPNSSVSNSPRHQIVGSPRQPNGYGSISSKRERKGLSPSLRPWNLYEDEEEGGSSSERSPFLRKRNARAQSRYQEQQPSSGMMSGMPFIIVILCLFLVVGVVVAAVLSTSQPLRDVRVLNITNVLVSKQELLFDVVIEAHNPNALAISVHDLEISVFAQSPYVRDTDNPKSPGNSPVSPNPGDPQHAATALKPATQVERQRRFEKRSGAGFWPPWHPGRNKSDGDYPEDEDSTTLLLGRVYEFDSTLLFESRFFNESVSTSSGELRVVKPGNITDEGGVETWERVIQHSFELIIRGVMKYQSSAFSKTVRTAELYNVAHINPAKFEGPSKPV